MSQQPGLLEYYARRAGYLEGALWVIAQGVSGIDPQEAAQRALDAVGEDAAAKRLSQGEAQCPGPQ